MRLALGGVLLALAGCGDSSGPSNELPSVGRYAYTYNGLDDRLDPISFAGALVITFISPDSLAGHWEVPGYNAILFDGLRLSDYWFVMATAPEEGVVSHEISPGDETLPVECGMTYNTGSGTRTIAGECSLERE